MYFSLVKIIYLLLVLVYHGLFGSLILLVSYQVVNFVFLFQLFAGKLKCIRSDSRLLCLFYPLSYEGSRQPGDCKKKIDQNFYKACQKAIISIFNKSIVSVEKNDENAVINFNQQNHSDNQNKGQIE